VITYRLTAAEQEARLIPGSSGIGADDRPFVTLTNPISVERAVMRHSVLSSVLEIAAQNSRFRDRIAIFEVGKVFLEAEDSVLPDELSRLSIVLIGLRSQPHWRVAAGDDMMDFFDLKGVLQGLFDSLHVTVNYEAAAHPSFRPGQTARLKLGEKQLGTMGVVHPQVVENYGFRISSTEPVLAADIDLELLFPHIEQEYVFQQVSAYPAVREDLAIIVDRDINAVDVVEIMQKSGGFLLKEVELFDLYEGPQVPSGKKSLAYHLTFQSPSKTLTDKDVSKQRNRIVKQLEQRLGARLRD
jgi:phenylalanyl-tRNA synthetase beta chain